MAYIILDEFNKLIEYNKKIYGATDELIIKTYFDILNEDSGEHYNEKGKHKLCRGIAHYVFRNGPIEDMHAKGQLSEEDMKTLNKFIMNRLGKLYDLFVDNKLNTEVLLSLHNSENYGRLWDDFEDIENM